MRLTGKVAVVTGADEGQGAAEARLLPGHGATVTTLGLGEAPVEDLPEVEHHRLDVTDAADGGMTAHGGVPPISDAVRTAS